MNKNQSIVEDRAVLHSDAEFADDITKKIDM